MTDLSKRDAQRYWAYLAGVRRAGGWANAMTEKEYLAWRHAEDVALDALDDFYEEHLICNLGEGDNTNEYFSYVSKRGRSKRRGTFVDVAVSCSGCPEKLQIRVRDIRSVRRHYRQVIDYLEEGRTTDTEGDTV